MSNADIVVNAFHPQAYLMFLGFYKKSKLKLSNLSPSGKTAAVHKITGIYEPSAVMSKLYNSFTSSGSTMIKGHFFNLPAYKITSLVPELRFYRVSNDLYTPFFFPISSISDQAVAADGNARLKGSGVKSFSVSYEGSDPFTAPKYLEADVQLYVDNLANIFDQHKGYAPLADMFTISIPKSTSKKSQSGTTITSGDLIRPIEVAATLGYSIVNRDIFTKEEIEEIQTSNLALRMNVFHHQINVNQDGSATIDIRYTARINNAGRDKIFSAIDTPVDLLKRADIRQLFAGEKKNISSTKKENKESPGSQQREQNKKARQLRRILEIAEKKKMIHSVKTDSPAILPTIRDPETGEAAGGDKYMESGDIRIYANLGVKKDVGMAAASLAVKTGTPKTPPANDILSKGNELLKRLADLDLSSRHIHYITFGDLVQCFFEMTEENLQRSKKVLNTANLTPTKDLKEFEEDIKTLREKTQDERDKISKVLDGAISRLKTFRILLSDIDYKYVTDSPNDKEKMARINIADVPISLDLFQSFIYDKILNSYRNTYTIPQFLNDCTSELLPRAFGSIFATANIAPSVISTAPVFISNSYSGPQLRGKLSNSPEVDVNKFQSPLKDFRASSIQDECDYFVIYQQADREIATKSKGKPDKDSQAGIYHFEIGKNRGLVKSINFSRFDVPYAQEQLMTNQVGLYDELKMPYQANITMFGNNLFMPGSQIYINPSNIGFGSPNLQNSAAYRLGLGGYYTVIKVQTSINDGVSETSLQCSFGSHPADNNSVSLKIGGVQSEVKISDLANSEKESFDNVSQGREEKQTKDVNTSVYSTQIMALKHPDTGQNVVDKPLARQISNDYVLHRQTMSASIPGVSRKYTNQQTGAARYELINGITLEIDDTSTSSESVRIVKTAPRTLSQEVENEMGPASPSGRVTRNRNRTEQERPRTTEEIKRQIRENNQRSTNTEGGGY